MPPSRSMAPLLRFCAMSSMICALAACDLMPEMATRPPTVLTRVQLERQEISPATLLCRPKPLPPEEGATQADVAVYLRELEAFGTDCSAKLADVREILRPSQEVTQ